ncbi:hypothetical protein F4778DRAFT_293876 [Xylariomycetidae sp. FL2044]|nr:hypothetical protein F4778DRAFT_293876 [Xylariomycetidae sp. FL2044]
MGIKGIYKEIGTGKRISLTKLAVDKLEETGRPLRVAIDISIWQFQVQAARGGSNPAIRTLFYRLLRLLSSSIQPIFVFDGPNKPAFKRNKRSGRGDGVATAMAKRLIRLFGFRVHDAPGEAEAECALLQQNGIVDAVLSEDVDTIMFGCTRTLRNWSSEGTKGNKTPTHISMYDTKDLLQAGTGLDREGMVLVALMSGGDYLPEGIPGAGVKLACEAAKAGFGTSLCKLKRSDTSEMTTWKEWLTYELRNNESGFFRTRHKALSIPDSFPNLEILRYYTHPVVSPASTLEKLRSQDWDKPIDIPGLREFVRETFDWTYRIGAIKFIRVLAPCLLVRKLYQRGEHHDHRSTDLEGMSKAESELVKSITNKRVHFSTDATPELRVSFIPTNIVGYDFQDEPDEVIEYGRDGLALNSDDEMENLEEDISESVAKGVSRKPFSPTEPDLFWIPETIVKLGIPLMVEDWEEAQRAKALAKTRPKASRQKSKTGGMAAGAMDKFMKVSKNLSSDSTNKSTASLPLPKPTSPLRSRSPLGSLPLPQQSLPSLLLSDEQPHKERPTTSSKPSKPRAKSSRKPPTGPKAGPSSNPWTIAGSQISTRVTKAAAATSTSAAKASETILISSSPPTSPTAARPPSLRRDGTRAETGARSGTDLCSSPPSSPQKRRSMTPPLQSRQGTGKERSRNQIRDLSPVPTSSEKPRRKLARTESMPTAPTTSPQVSRSARQGGFRKAQTIAVDPDIDSDSDDDDFDLPPLNSIIGRIPGSSGGFAKPLPSPSSMAVATTTIAPTTTTTKQTQTQGRDTPKSGAGTGTVDDDAMVLSGGGRARTTKLYVPRKSAAGFFREIEVSIDEADVFQDDLGRMSRSSTSRVWRRSDISCIDLTGED